MTMPPNYTPEYVALAMRKYGRHWWECEQLERRLLERQTEFDARACLIAFAVGLVLGAVIMGGIASCLLTQFGLSLRG